MTETRPTRTVYNRVGSDGSWFSPFGWRTRALLLLKQVPVEWVDIRPSELGKALSFADARTTPLLVDRSDRENPVVLKDTWSIATHLESTSPEPNAFPEGAMTGIRLFNGLIDSVWQIPGFAAFSPWYFSNGVIRGADEPLFRGIVQKATGRSVEENAARVDALMQDFWLRLRPLERSLLRVSGCTERSATRMCSC